VTAGFVEEGVIIGTFAACAFSAIAMDTEEAASPRISTTLSWVISRVTACAASSGRPWLSYTRTASFLPFTPPAELASLSASSMPLRAEIPKVASLPVRLPTSPRRMVSELGGGPPALASVA
jgi:hypothetical protein